MNEMTGGVASILTCTVLKDAQFAVGLINGLTVVKTRLPSFIVTLATFFVLQGVNAAGYHLRDCPRLPTS